MKLKNTIITYIILTAAAYIFDKIYALFGHGVSSPWMSNMYICLLILGVVVYTALSAAIPDIVLRKGYRLFYNTYNSGIAVLITGMLLKGILDIAGGTSRFVSWFLYTAYGFLAAALIIFLMIVRENASAKNR